MTARLRTALTSTTTCLLLAVTGCSTGSANPPQTEGSGEVSGTTGETSGTGSGSTVSGSSGSTAPSGTSPTSGSSGTSAASGATSGTSTGTSGATTSGTASGSSGSSTGATTGASTGSASGSGSGASGATAGPSFANDVYNNLGLCTTCLPCHSPPNGGGYKNGKLDLSTSANAYANLVGIKAAGTACGTSGLTRVVVGSAATSLLYNKLKAKTMAGATAPCGNGMPETGTALTAADLMVVEDWINMGAAP